MQVQLCDYLPNQGTGQIVLKNAQIHTFIKNIMETKTVLFLPLKEMHSKVFSILLALHLSVCIHWIWYCIQIDKNTGVWMHICDYIGIWVGMY